MSAARVGFASSCPLSFSPDFQFLFPPPGGTPDFQFLFLPPGWVIGFLRSADLTIKRLFELLNRAMHLTQVLSTG